MLVAPDGVANVSAPFNSEMTFQAMLDAAPDAMIGVTAEGIIVMANLQTEELFGYKRSELVGEPVELLVPDRVRGIHPSHRADFFRDPKTRSMGSGLDPAGRRADGSQFPVGIRLSSIETADGTIALASIRDITERKRAVIEVQEAMEVADRAADDLRRTNKELETFSYAVAHDLRAPLRAIDGFCQALVEDHSESLDESARGYLDRVRRNVQWMADMIDGLLGLSRLTRTPLDLTDVDLSTLAEETAAALRAAEPDRQIELIIESGISVQADPQLLRMLVGNLVENAWKFTGPHDRARIEFGVSRRPGGRVFFVRDDGVGFDGRYVDKLFAPFQRLHRAEEFPGSGIGLATVDRIVRRHGGEIWAESELGRGATFYFTLESRA
jgi:PAS domain S-box-containing protein